MRIRRAGSDLKSRGHGVLVYQQADDLYQQYLDDPRLSLFKDNPHIVDGYAWKSVPWQLSQGVPPLTYSMSKHYVPPEFMHPAIGAHETVNKFLVDYINKHSLLT